MDLQMLRPRQSIASLVAVLLLGCCSMASQADELDWLSGGPTATVADGTTTNPMPMTSYRKVGAALAVVLGGFFLWTVAMRKQRTMRPINEMMEPLGSVQIAPKVRLHLVRFGKRILVLNISGQNVQRVAELEDPDEVQKLLAIQPADNVPTIPASVSTLLQDVEQSAQPLRSLHR